MAGSVNKVILVGNLGRDPETRRLNSGDPVVNMSVATSEQWRDKQSGERRERTEWHRVVIFNPNLCDVAEKYLKKGSKVYLEGQLQTRKWQDQSGQDRYTTRGRHPALPRRTSDTGQPRRRRLSRRTGRRAGRRSRCRPPRGRGRSRRRHPVLTPRPAARPDAGLPFAIPAVLPSFPGRRR